MNPEPAGRAGNGVRKACCPHADKEAGCRCRCNWYNDPIYDVAIQNGVDLAIIKPLEGECESKS